MRTVKADWQAAIITCGKCSRRMGGGFGAKGKTSLAKALRRLGNGKKGRKAGFGVIETGCLKLCPKNAAVAFNAADPQNWHIVGRGTDAEDVVGLLGLDLFPRASVRPFSGGSSRFADVRMVERKE